MEITAVVVTYNRLELLKENIEALKHQSVPDLSILVVNNASTDGTKEYLDEVANNQIGVLHLEENMGGAGGFYYGMKKAYKEGADLIWIMDDDTIPTEDALENLLYAHETFHGEYGFLASDVRWMDGSCCIMNQVHKLDKVVETYDRIDTATFVSLLIPRETVEKIGLPIKEYFIWGDDKEYTLRASDYKPSYFVPASKVIHKMKSNFGSNISTDDLERVGRYFYAYRNDYVTAKKRGAKSLFIYYAGFALNFLRVILKSEKGKKERIEVMKKGLSEGRRFHVKEEMI